MRFVEGVDTLGAGSVLDGLDLVDELPDINIANDLCATPWLWQGPFNVVTGDQEAYYSACNA